MSSNNDPKVLTFLKILYKFPFYYSIEKFEKKGFNLFFISYFLYVLRRDDGEKWK